MGQILLVEDHEVLHRFLCDAIEQAGHEADCVKTRREAELALSSRHYDLLISDLRLPDGSGHDLATTAVDRGTKIMLITGHPDEVTVLSDQQVAQLEKPFSLDEFITLLESTLAR